MSRSSLVAVVLLFLAWTESVAPEAAPPAPDKPHIVFVLVDDWGYADVGFRNPAIKTPNFDELATSGVVLDRHYVFKYCSPSRASFLTGRWPHHVHQWNLPPGRMAGTSLNMTMLPAKLKKAGYATHMVGKWHQGTFRSEYIPVSRGFDSSSGFLGGGENHMTQRVGCAVDFWKNRAPDTRNGTYDAFTYRDDLTELIGAHDPSTPLFLYLPLHNVHTPLQAPDEWVDLYPNTTCKNRRVYQAMVSVADNVTGVVVEALKKRGMWENTLMVISADNGGAPCSGSNYPLKGCKGTFFEGGVLSLAFANGGVLPSAVRGMHNKGFIHIADWYATFCKMAGVDPDDSGPGRFPVDGLDVWPILSGANLTTPHDEIVLGFNFTNSHPDQGALIAGNYKLIVGPQGFGCDSLMHSPLDYPCSQGPKAPDCNPNCLYDIVNDPQEETDLSTSHPDILNQMMERYNKFSAEPQSERDQGYHSESLLPNDPNACKVVESMGDYWRPWRDGHEHNEY